MRQVATRRFYQDKFPADWILNRKKKTFSDIEHRLRETGGDISCCSRTINTRGRFDHKSCRSEKWMTVQKYWDQRAEDRRCRTYRQLGCVARATWGTLYGLQPGQGPTCKVYPDKVAFVSGPRCSVILLFSPSCSSQTPQVEYEMASETSRINIREQMSVHVESIRRETNKDLK